MRCQCTKSPHLLHFFSYDPASRLEEIAHNLGGSANDINIGFSFTPAGQLDERTRDNSAYLFDDHTVGTTSYSANGLNQYDGITPPGQTAATTNYDARGNMTLYNPQDSAISRWVYDRLGRITNSEMTDASGTTVEADYSYDPLGRLYEVTVVGGGHLRWRGHSTG